MTVPPTPSSAVEILEVSPRDGLQNEPEVWSVTDRIALIRRAIAMGARRIEAVSFVNPKRVPQMADAEAVLAGLGEHTGVSIAGLVLNERGVDRALTAKVDEINYVVVATEAFSQRNQGQSCQQTLDGWRRITARAASSGIFRTVTIAAAFGCPFEGEVPVDQVVRLAREVAEHGVDELALADTIGVAVPTDVETRLAAVRAAVPGVPLRVHLHNTRNTGFANAVAAVRSGVTVLDAALGGIGGCPFAPAATGNIATEDLVYLLHRMGYSTGLAVPQVLSAAAWVGEVLGRSTPGMLVRAGLFPTAV